jgi:tetratricopeptide (TPR) repeat protein
MTDPLPTPDADQRRQIAARLQLADQVLGHAPGVPDPRRVQAALALFAECRDLDPGNLTYRRRVHELRRNMAKPPGLLARWRRWRASARLRAASASGDAAAVLRTAEALLDVDPDNTAAYRAMAVVFEKVGPPDNAAWCLEQALAAGAPPQETREQLARLLERRGRFTQAAEMRGEVSELAAERDRLTRELATKPGDFDLAWALADWGAEYFRRDLATAAARLQELPEEAERRAVYEELVREVQTREIALWQQKADRYPGDLSHRFELGVRLLKVGQFEAALEAFERSTADERLRWRSLVYAAYCHLNRRKPQLARPLLEEALPLIPEGEPMRPEVVRLLGNA